GTDAEAENQRDIPRSSATASSARARHRPEGAGGARTSGAGRDKTPRLATGGPSSKFQNSKGQAPDQGNPNPDTLRWRPPGGFGAFPWWSSCGGPGLRH